MEVPWDMVFAFGRHVFSVRAVVVFNRDRFCVRGLAVYGLTGLRSDFSIVFTVCEQFQARATPTRPAATQRQAAIDTWVILDERSPGEVASSE